MQAIELETSIVRGEIHAKLPNEINAEKARLIVLYETVPPAEGQTASGVVRLLDEITGQRSWPSRSKEEIDRALEEERAAWD